MRPIPPADADPRSNALLGAVPASEWSRWSIYLEPVRLSSGLVLSDSGRAPGYVYFPTTAIVSLLYVTENGASSELAVIGHEGIVGVSQFMGGNTMPYQAVVHGAGLGFRLRAQVVDDEMRRGGALQLLLLRYAQTLMDQVAQTAACNRYYSIEQLVCRRLLLGLDRVSSDVLMMTQELLAGLLGVRREGVTAAALRLQAAGAIRYSRGRINVLDRAQLALQALDRPMSRRQAADSRHAQALQA